MRTPHLWFRIKILNSQSLGIIYMIINNFLNIHREVEKCIFHRNEKRNELTIGLETCIWLIWKSNILLNFTVAGNTQNSASMTILPMPRMPRNRLLWRQWKWSWCCINRLVPWKWWTGWIEWIWWTNSSPPVMWTPACGAWVNWAGTCPRPQPSKPTPSVGKDYITVYTRL